MGQLSVSRRDNRGAIMLPLGGTAEKPNVIIPLYKKLERSELHNLILAECAKHGLTEKQAEMTRIFPLPTVPVSCWRESTA